MQGTTVGRAYANARSYGDRPKTTEEVQREHRQEQQRQAENARADRKKAVKFMSEFTSHLKNK